MPKLGATRVATTTHCHILLFILLMISDTRADPLIRQQIAQATQIAANFPLPLKHSLYAPILKVKSYEGYLSEEAEPGTMVRLSPSILSDSLQILVEDKDLKAGMKPSIYQYLIEGYGAEKFAVDQRGYLYRDGGGSGLDADRHVTSYRLHVRATEVDTVERRSSLPITLHIHIVDVNDNEPSFAHTTYEARVSAYGAERAVAKVQARDADAGKFGQIIYRIREVSDGATDAFRYDVATNELRAIGALEPGKKYKVKIEARDGGGLVGQTTVLVHAIADTNDHPVSATPFPHLTNNNNEALAKAYQNYLAKNAEIMLRNSPQPNATPFPILSPTFNRRATASPTNSHTESEERQLQTIDESLDEATPRNSIVAVLGDESTRDKIYFRIVSGNENGRFHLNPETGAISNAEVLDREEQEFYTLVVEARSRRPDQHLYSTILKINILDTNDNAPQFLDAMRFKLVASDLARNGCPDCPDLKLGQIRVVDRDKGENGTVSLRILPPMNEYYTIDDGVLRIRGRFTTTHMGEHRLAVVAQDRGTPPLESRGLITVEIVNDAPSAVATVKAIENWSGAAASESESSGAVSSNHENIDDETNERRTGVGTRIGSLRSGTGSGSRSFGGAASSATEASESAGNAALFHRATFPPFTSKKPESSPAPFTIVEMSGGGSGSSSSDENPDSTASTTPPAPFTGALRLAPIFTNPSFRVSVEENDQDRELCVVEAKYPDELGGSITYVIENGDTTLFSIDKQSGKLTLLKELDAEVQQNYTLQIGTQESTQLTTNPSLAHSAQVLVLVLDVNDWIPSFNEDIYAFSLRADAPIGSLIGQISANDQDAQPPNNRLKYQIENNDNLQYYFGLDIDTGEIRLLKNIGEFRGQKLELKVKAEDGGEISQTTRAIVEIHVMEEISSTSTKKTASSITSTTTTKPNVTQNSFNAIQFESKNYSVSIAERKRSPITALTLRVINRMAGGRFMCAIVSGNDQSAFRVTPTDDASSPSCLLRTEIELDRERVPSYTLNISVQSGVDTGYALVIVNVADENDNAPRFSFSSTGPGNAAPLDYYFAVLSMGTPAGTPLLKVKAEDQDVGLNGAVRYELDALTPDSKAFSINATSGEVSLRRALISSEKSSGKNTFDFMVIACDSAPPNVEKLCSKAQILINLLGPAHRFVTVIRGARSEEIRAHEMDLIRALRPYTGNCSWIGIERLVGAATASTDSIEPTSSVYWYAADPRTKRVCHKREFRKLFNASAKSQLASSLQQWFTIEEVGDQLDELDLESDSEGGDSSIDLEDPNTLVIPWRNVDWRKSFSSAALMILFAAAFVAFVGFCSLLVFRCRRQRRNASSAKRRRRSVARTFPGIYPIVPKYNHPVGGGHHTSNPSFYLPTLTAANLYGAGGGVPANSTNVVGAHHLGSMERAVDKYYETQMHELSISDEDFTLPQPHHKNNSHLHQHPGNFVHRHNTDALRSNNSAAHHQSQLFQSISSQETNETGILSTVSGKSNNNNNTSYYLSAAGNGSGVPRNSNNQKSGGLRGRLSDDVIAVVDDDDDTNSFFVEESVRYSTKNPNSSRGETRNSQLLNHHHHHSNITKHAF